MHQNLSVSKSADDKWGRALSRVERSVSLATYILNGNEATVYDQDYSTEPLDLAA